METIGIKIENTDIYPNSLEYIDDLLYLDGPILSLFKKPETQTYYLYKWITNDEAFNRWLVFSTNAEGLYNFLSKKISLRDLMFNSPETHCVDINSDGEVGAVFKIKHEELNGKYIASKKSYYSEVGYTNFAREFKSQIWKEFISQFTKSLDMDDVIDIVAKSLRFQHVEKEQKWHLSNILVNTLKTKPNTDPYIAHPVISKPKKINKRIGSSYESNYRRI